LDKAGSQVPGRISWEHIDAKVRVASGILEECSEAFLGNVQMDGEIGEGMVKGVPAEPVMRSAGDLCVFYRQGEGDKSFTDVLA
jgi:hypothetical protein